MDIQALPRRVRFYHSKIDVGSLESSADYQELKNVIVIMIMPYDDGAKTIFLYTNGTEGNPAEKLYDLLQYMKETNLENARNDTLKAIHRMVESVKRDAEVSLAYMRIMKREEDIARRERRKAEAKISEAEAKIRELEAEIIRLKCSASENKTLDEQKNR